MSASRVVCVGDVMLDVVATASTPLARGSDASARVRTHGGGGGANVAAWLSAIGVPALLVARVGDDAAGREVIAELRAGGVDVRAAIDPELPTGTCVVIVEPDGERTFLPDRGANAALAVADLPPDAFGPGGHLHLSGYPLLAAGPGRAAARAALARARAAGMTISVDPASSAPLRALGAERFLAWVAGALLVPNAAEAAALTGEHDPELAARLLARRGGGEAAVTLGAAGALWSDGGQVVRAASVPVRGDSTGAGDAWVAGWLGARLGGADVPSALAAAGALGARAVALAGGRPGGGPGARAAGGTVGGPPRSLPGMRRFLHVARADDWQAAGASGSYAVPAGKDPFTHCCFPEQLPGVLERFYPSDRSGLVLLDVEPAGLPVRVEQASDGAGDFPHVYGPIPVASVVGVRPVA